MTQAVRHDGLINHNFYFVLAIWRDGSGMMEHLLHVIWDTLAIDYVTLSFYIGFEIYVTRVRIILSSYY